MKGIIFTLSVVVLTVGIGTSAQAQNYPWCAIYSGDMGGAQDDVSGIGGFCQLNDTYTPTGGGASSRHKPHTHY
jgi:hypothetical protein